jgi:DNA-binding CsgD family transcriptional regulator
MDHGLRHRQAIEAGGIGAWERDLTTHVVTISPVLAQLMGLPPDKVELTAQEWQEMVLPEYLPLLVRGVPEQAIATQEPFDLQFRLMRPDGKIITLVSRGTILYGEHGRPVKAIGVCFPNKDGNTERKRLLELAAILHAAEPVQSGSPLTKKQREVLRSVVDGKSVRETAIALCISEGTVRQHQRDARNRLGARTVMHAVSLAVHGNLL